MARLANALVTLRAQIDAAHPGRAKFNDGWIGDAAHAARKSDHNPNAAGVVQAIDLSHDPAHGFDSYVFADFLRQKRDHRIKYVISNGRIFSSLSSPWEWRPYTGADSHAHHVHISVSDDPRLYDDAAPWDGDPSGTAPAPPQAPALRSTVTPQMRATMARHILDFEARRDRSGHLAVYQLPANDGGGSYEVAGINEKYDGPEAAKLRQMIEAGQFDAAETEAESYILQNTDPASSWTWDAGVEFMLRDCVFNRGAHGAARILQRACGVPDDGQIGPISRAAIATIAPSELLTKLRAAREDYERNVVGYRANFWQGLVNRWDKALAIARAYPPTPATPGASMPTTTPAPTSVQLHGLDLHQIASALGTVVGFLPMAAKFFPPIAPLVPFIPLIKGALDMVAELQDKGHDPQSIVDVIVKHLGDIKLQVEALHNQVQSQVGAAAPGGSTTTGG